MPLRKPAPKPRFSARCKQLGICLGLMLVAGLTVAMVSGRPGRGVAATTDQTASVSAAPVQLGPSGLPLPRFVTLKANKINVRKGPTSDHDVAWVYQRKGLPVEIIAESDNWRKIRDEDGTEGWVLQSMLSGKRSATVASWAKDKAVMLRDEASASAGFVAKLDAGVLVAIDSCDGRWCEISTGDYEGYAAQSELWGVYPGETLD